MLVKKTKKGKIACTLSHHESDYILDKIVDYIELNTILLRARHLDSESKLHLMIRYNIVTDLLKKHNITFASTETENRFSFSNTEALALLMILKESNLPIAIQELKSSLHKLLS